MNLNAELCRVLSWYATVAVCLLIVVWMVMLARRKS